MKKIIVLMALMSIPANVKADEIIIQLESLLQPPPITKRIERFLKKHKVKRPAFYARIISEHPMPDIQKKVMAAILVPESRGDANAVSPAGATGAWQIMPGWKKKLSIKGSLKDPITNLNAAVRVYNIHAEEVNYHPRRTLIGYSGRTPGYADNVLRLVSSI